ncbi:MAG: CHAT domain-containing protein, partial [Pyrinomonadaceae bacterium]
AIKEKTLGPDNPDTIITLSNLAKLYRAKGDLNRALSFQGRVVAPSERNIDLNLTIGSERQKLAYLSSLGDSLDATISLHTQSLPQSDEAKRLALLLILSRKGRTLDALADSVAALRRRALPEDQAALDRLSEARTELATLTLKGVANDDPEEYKLKLKSLEDKKEGLEQEMSRRSAEFRAQRQPITIEAIQSAIPPNAALIEFAVYHAIPESLLGQQTERKTHYVAYILQRGAEIEWKELGEAKPVDEAIAAFRQALRDSRRSDVQQLARAVDEKVMQPIRALLRNRTQLLISPDGALNLIPFEALVDERNRYLVERYSFTYLTSGRDLLRLQVTRDSKNNPVVIANPSFGTPAPELVKTTLVVKPAFAASRRRSVTTGSDLSAVYFAPLRATAQEAHRIEALFPEATLLTGAQATEPTVKQVVAPRILHFATHGFFLQDTGSPTTDRRFAGTQGIKTGVRIENPLLRSGLALAGANLRNTGGDDGILTALEASGLNLWGTKLIVLSACDTGVGEVRNGQGIYGLRRAFVLAGVESLVMSLWPASDYVTRALMTNYYRDLKQGLGRGAALRHVQLEMLKQNRRLHPFYWANFIQSGEWANLDGKR